MKAYRITKSTNVCARLCGHTWCYFATPTEEGERVLYQTDKLYVSDWKEHIFVVYRNLKPINRCVIISEDQPVRETEIDGPVTPLEGERELLRKKKIQIIRSRYNLAICYGV